MARITSKHPLQARFHYLTDRLLGSGTIAQVAVLGLVAAMAIATAVVILMVSGIQPGKGGGGAIGEWGFAEAVWQAIAHTTDGGTMGNDPPTWSYRLVMFTMTMLGMLVISSLIGLLTTGLVKKLDELRRGRSVVLERDHTLILGWSPSVFTILSELAIANEGRKRPRVVILADKDKVEMEQEIRTKAGRLGRTRVICRTGLPIDLDDLEIVNPDEARSIIVLAPESEDADTHVLKTILALTNGPHRKAGKYHIVAELQDPRKREVAQLVGGDELEVILGSEVVTRLTVQTCFQSGLSNVYTELFDFDGDEIYLKGEPGLVGKTFKDALLSYEACAVIGMRFADGEIALNPPMDTPITAQDQLFAITRDSAAFTLDGSEHPPIDHGAIKLGERLPPPGPKRTLILGWNRRVPAIVREMDYYVADLSEVTIVADLPEPVEELQTMRAMLHNQTVQYWRGDTTNFATLEALDVYNYHHVIVVGYTELLGQQEADAHTLVTLLYMRTLVERTQAKLNIVSEMLNVRNRELARVTKVDDFIVSAKIISLMLAQVSENKHLNAVFTDLLDTEGQEMYLKPAADYVELGRPVNFCTVVEAARMRNEVAIGHRLMSTEARKGAMDGVSLNVPKSTFTTYTPADRVIVLAES